MNYELLFINLCLLPTSWSLRGRINTSISVIDDTSSSHRKITKDMRKVRMRNAVINQ